MCARARTQNFASIDGMKCGQTWDEDKPLPVLYGPAESHCNGEYVANVHLIEGGEHGMKTLQRKGGG
jgi:hypothetical protein